MQHHKLSTISLIVIASALLFTSTEAAAKKSKSTASSTTTTTTTTTTSSSAPAAVTVSANPDKGGYKGAVLPVPCHYPKLLHDGFYVGGQLGYDAYRFRFSTNLSFPPVGTSPGLISVGNPVISANGFGGGLFGGYGTYWENYYYTGAEIFVNGSTANQSQYINTNDGNPSANYTQVSAKNVSWGISVIPGVKYSDSSLIYIRLGYSRAKLKGTNTVLALDPPTGGVAYFPASKHQWAGGMSYGIGIETALYKKISVRSEWNHYGYNTFSDPLTNNYGASNNQLMVSLIYHFV